MDSSDSELQEMLKVEQKLFDQALTDFVYNMNEYRSNASRTGHSVSGIPNNESVELKNEMNMKIEYYGQLFYYQLKKIEDLAVAISMHKKTQSKISPSELGAT